MSRPAGSARDRALRLLARRNHSSAELRLKLHRRGYAAEEIAQVLEECFARGYLNDEETALRWAEGLVRTKCWGRLKVGAYLAQKGIGRDVIDRVQRRIWQDFSEEAVGRRAFQKRFAASKIPPPPAQAAAFLKSRGFSAPVIYRVAGMAVPDDDTT